MVMMRQDREQVRHIRSMGGSQDRRKGGGWSICAQHATLGPYLVAAKHRELTGGMKVGSSRRAIY